MKDKKKLQARRNAKSAYQTRRDDKEEKKDRNEWKRNRQG
jgi:hypothetical protein